ncbi:hypothetical protein CLF_102389 [Clonorchis sinensis]|uniref:Uncharacterized protein n=1 Tax=Clonorchis sinensis TaxID=79923 RepID=G7Y7T8_CLOSI|nr:hypothetical protein CLF_102389 [Clonorchis sinensis]
MNQSIGIEKDEIWMVYLGNGSQTFHSPGYGDMILYSSLYPAVDPVTNILDYSHSDVTNFELYVQSNQQTSNGSGDFQYAKPIQVVRTLQAAHTSQFDSAIRNFSLSLPRGTNACEDLSANGTEMVSFCGSKYSGRRPLPTVKYRMMRCDQQPSKVSLPYVFSYTTAFCSSIRSFIKVCGVSELYYTGKSVLH